MPGCDWLDAKFVSEIADAASRLVAGRNGILIFWGTYFQCTVFCQELDYFMEKGVTKYQTQHCIVEKDGTYT